MTAFVTPSGMLHRKARLTCLLLSIDDGACHLIEYCNAIHLDIYFYQQMTVTPTVTLHRKASCRRLRECKNMDWFDNRPASPTGPSLTRVSPGSKESDSSRAIPNMHGHGCRFV